MWPCKRKLDEEKSKYASFMGEVGKKKVNN
jgi:hypothetical protein